MPRPLAALVMVGTVGDLANVTATFLSVDLTTSLTPVLATPSALAEISLLAWLVVRGLAPPVRDDDLDVSHSRRPAAAVSTTA